MKISYKYFFYFLIPLFIFSSLFFNFSLAQMSPEQERSVLEKELKELENQIVQYENDITKTQKEKNTLQNQISIFKKKISQLDAQIKKSNLIIKDLGVQIKDTEGSIVKTSSKIEDSKQKLSNILKTLYEEDQKSLVEVLLSEPKLSDFFDNIITLEILNQKNQELLKNIKDLKVNLEDQKVDLDGEKGDLEKITKIQTLQKEESLQSKKQQEVVLEQTKGKESEYQKLLQVSKKRAEEIRTRIFQLFGVADVQAPTFAQALEMARFVEGVTGVRAALVLAILTQESSIGKNVGRCYLTNSATGAGVNISSGTVFANVMKPSRDVSPFLTITQELGRDPYKTQVSCPIPSVGGYGGAMGPAQFIPSTWMLYRGRIGGILGVPGDPWKIKDSFLATGLYLADSGATKQTTQAEWCAAVSYFSGNCSVANQKRYGFYSDSVLRIAKGYEADIQAIQSSLGTTIK